MNGEIIQILPAEHLSFLAAVYRWGIEVIKVIQTIKSPGLTAVMKFITALGTEVFIVPLLLFVFWCVDEKRGFRLIMLVIFSTWVNVSLKSLFKQPRPYNLEPAVGLAVEPSYGIPSGHAQTALVVWGALFFRAASKKRDYSIPLRTGAVLFILLIGFTRLYLGVHFPTDLLGGWLLGGLILTAFHFLSPWISGCLKTAGKRSQLIWTAAAALIMNGLHPEDTSLAALFLGFGCGYSLMINSFPFSAAARKPSGGKGQLYLARAARYAIGLAGTGVIYLGLRLLFPGEDSLLAGIPGWGGDTIFYELGRFIRYGLIGLWVSAGAPWFFLRAGIAEPSVEADIG
jgi:membrane-associated phospholipid phosphatase